jgi:hypothetical protein
MSRSQGSTIVVGIILILVGGIFLAVQLIPGFNIGFDIELTWPLILVAIGLLLFLGALLSNQPGLAVPAAIVGGIGGILYWQESVGDYSSWSFAWTLIPGFVGLGAILEGILSGNFWKSLNAGGVLILISLSLFLVFGSIFGQVNILGSYWPVLLIILGFLLLGRTLYDAWRG